LYPWGTDEISAELANYSSSDKGQTMPIGSYEANGVRLNPSVPFLSIYPDAETLLPHEVTHSSQTEPRES
jgi:hypothetical protein